MTDDIDPRGLIREAYRIDSISEADCRAVFLDWAVGLPEGVTADHLARLEARYGPEHPQHPMTAILREGLSRSGTEPTRRGGHSARRR